MPQQQNLNILEGASVPIGVLILSGPEYVITFINQKILELWGRTKEQVFNKPLYEALPELKGQGFEDLLEGVYTTGIPYLGNEIPAELVRNGKKEIVYFNFTYNPILDDQNNIVGISVIASDATEQVKTKQQIQKSEERYRALLEQTPAFIAILRGKDFIFEYVNPPYYQLVGFRDILNKPVLEALPEVKDQGFIELLNAVYTTGKEFEGKEMKIFLQKSPEKLLEESYVNFVYQALKDEKGNITGIFAHGTDVTDQVLTRKKIEENTAELALSRETLQLALEAGKIGVWDWNVQDNTLTWTDRVYEIHDQNKKNFEVNFANFSALIHPDDKSWVQQELKDSLDSKKEFNVTFRIQTPTGKIRWLVTSATVIKDSHNRPVRMLGATSDITEQKKVEEDKNDFVGIATHELKTPVTSIKAYTQALLRRFKKNNDDSSAELLEKMDGQINKLTSLIQDLLDVTKIEGGRLQFTESDFNFDDLISETVEELQRTTEKHKIIIEGKTSKTIFGDRDRIGQVITNFISNAIKYSPHANKILVCSSVENNNIKVSVQDFGVGIPEDKQDKVFERFYRVSGPREKTFPGLGLGLYISSEIIKRQGGKIWVESVENKGSTFHFLLPVSHEHKLVENPLLEEEMKHS